MGFAHTLRKHYRIASEKTTPKNVFGDSSKPLITCPFAVQGNLQALQDAVKAATNKPEKAEVLLQRDSRRQMARSKDDFRVFLAPFLHGKR